MKDRFTDFYVRMLGKGDGASYAYDTAFLDKSLYYWIEEDPMGYGGIYDKAASLVYQMQEQMGEDEFDLALKEYVQNFAYGIVTTTSFKDYWNTKSDFSELFELYLKVS